MGTNPIMRAVSVALVAFLCAGIAIAYAYLKGIDEAAPEAIAAPANPLESVVAQMREENETLRLQVRALEADLQIEREKTDQYQAQAQIVAAGGTADFQRQVGGGVEAILEANATAIKRDSAVDTYHGFLEPLQRTMSTVVIVGLFIVGMVSGAIAFGVIAVLMEKAGLLKRATSPALEPLE